MRVRAQQVLDEVVRGDEAVVLWDGQILRVSALAHSIRELSRDWIELSDLAVALAQRHGAPDGDLMDALTPVVADLASAGLVETRD
ncbi:hypothetical protein [Ornithinimicrobium cryptoxanthini]|uniref:Coenzyme PQQ synthesis protein D (PqqD) n=1 Tax=Ornithinimicrobium cryptoxanthini TaxID=2934161 RepID=A0ABY4YHX7_9MICO|nr:hypothetical protein [Ornithinimicrobium cryptoxanthini]USQ76204.1 hypothetical protein NF557_16700 [Ornithinimicrobium cryptoxanthini]